MARVRKQVYHLTLDDIARYPVWEYALDEEGRKGQDEATVRPVDPARADFAESSYMVRSRFTLANGTTLLGIVTVSGLPDDDIIKIEGDVDSNARRQPVIITARGQVGFWFGGIKPEPKDVAEAYRILGTPAPDAVFPIAYSTEVQTATGPIRGRIGGFQYLEDKTSCLDCIMRELR